MQGAADLALPAFGVQLVRSFDAIRADGQHRPQSGAFAVGLGYASQQGLHEMHRRRVASLEELTKPCDRLEAGGAVDGLGSVTTSVCPTPGPGGGTATRRVTVRRHRDPAGDRTAAPGPGGLPYGGTHAVELAAACSSTAAGSARHELGATGGGRRSQQRPRRWRLRQRPACRDPSQL